MKVNVLKLGKIKCYSIIFLRDMLKYENFLNLES